MKKSVLIIILLVLITACVQVEEIPVEKTVEVVEVIEEPVVEEPIERPSSVDIIDDDFSNLETSRNTFWLGGDDGWDWSADVYSGHPSNVDECVAFSNNGRLEIGIGNCDGNDKNGQGSGAYGIEFIVDEDAYYILQQGGKAILSFDWEYAPMHNDLDANENVWVRATIGKGKVYAYEDFESAYLGIDYKWTGGFGWLGNWHLIGDGIDISADEYSGREAMELLSGENKVTRSADLEDTAMISFYAKAMNLEENDTVSFIVDDEVLETWGEGDDTNEWQEYVFEISGSEISFETSFDEYNDAFYVDQIKVYEGEINYLGEDLDSTDQEDVENEIHWINDPSGSESGSEVIDVTEFIDGEGSYYLTLGGQVYAWSSKDEGANFYFDNVELSVS